MDRYNFKTVEKKWQTFWEENKSFKSEIDKNKKKFYCLEMFPYPSGKIHMGHVRNYTIGDVLARYKTLQGFNVLHPMGWDSFGMPAENAARENNLDPNDWTEKNISVMKNQLKKLGLSIDWDREISTCSEEYYKHQQLFFLELLEKGLVYRKENYVNWDPVDETVLANEQVIDGKGWRSGAIVERKKLSQWFFNISKFSQELLDGLESLDAWPNKVKTMQKNWIGKSFGCEIDFKIEGNLPVKKIKCFTTRPDTLFGFSFLALSLDHEVSKFYEKNEEFNKFFREKFTKNRFMPEREIIKEEAMQQVRFPDFKKIMPTIKITEAWGKLGNADRGVIEKFTAALGGKDNSVDDKLNRINDIITGDKEDYTLSELLTVMVVIETLGAILGEFTESAGGFIFEGFLAGLFGGKSVQIERPEDLPEPDDDEERLEDAAAVEQGALNESDEEGDEEQAGKPITDVVLQFKDRQGKMKLRHYSLKLLGPTTSVKGSFRNMVKHFKSFDHVVYLDARVTDGRTRMKFSEFEITLERFLKVFYEPFKRFATQKESFGDLTTLAAKLTQINSGEEEYLSTKFAKRPPPANELERLGIDDPNDFDL